MTLWKYVRFCKSGNIVGQTIMKDKYHKQIVISTGLKKATPEMSDDDDTGSVPAN